MRAIKFTRVKYDGSRGDPSFTELWISLDHLAGWEAAAKHFVLILSCGTTVFVVEDPKEVICS